MKTLFLMTERVTYENKEINCEYAFLPPTLQSTATSLPFTPLPQHDTMYGAVDDSNIGK